MNDELVTQCDCGDPAHMMYFSMWDDLEEPRLCVSVQLNPFNPWWKRLWYALLYVLGKPSRYSFGHWDEGCIGVESARELRRLVLRFIRQSEAYWDEQEAKADAEWETNHFPADVTITSSTDHSDFSEADK